MKLIFCSLIFALVIIGGGYTAFACTCSLHHLEDIQRLAQEPQRFFFVGEVKKIVESTIYVGSDNRPVVTARYVTFQIRQTWQKHRRGTIKIVTGGGYGDCGFRFKEKETYFVDAWENDKEFSTSICTLTNELVNAQYEIAELDKWRAVQQTTKRKRR